MKEIPGFPHYYINTEGEVFSDKRGNFHLLSVITSPNGYKSVCLSNPTRQTIPIAYLLALTYLPNPNHKSKVTFRDSNPKNLDIMNIKWI